MTAGSIPELVMCRCGLGKDTSRLFPVGAEPSIRLVAYPEERHANRTQKSALRWCVRQKQRVWFIPTNERYIAYYVVQLIVYNMLINYKRKLFQSVAL